MPIPLGCAWWVAQFAAGVVREGRGSWRAWFVEGAFSNTPRVRTGVRERLLRKLMELYDPFALTVLSCAVAQISIF